MIPSIHLLELILSEIREIGALPLHIPMPEDSRVLRICQVGHPPSQFCPQASM